MGEGQAPRKVKDSILSLSLSAVANDIHRLAGMQVSVGIGDRKERYVA